MRTPRIDPSTTGSLPGTTRKAPRSQVYRPAPSESQWSRIAPHRSRAAAGKRVLWPGPQGRRARRRPAGSGRADRRIWCRKPRTFTATSSEVAAPRDASPQPEMLHRDPVSSRGAPNDYAATSDALPQPHLESRRPELSGRNLSYFAATSDEVAVPRDASPRPQLIHRNPRCGCGAPS